MSLQLIIFAVIATWIFLLGLLAWLTKESKRGTTKKGSWRKVANAWSAAQAKYICIEPVARTRNDGKVVYQPMISDERCYKSFTSAKYETYDHIWLEGEPTRQIVQRRYRWMAVFTAYLEVRRRNKDYNARIIL